MRYDTAIRRLRSIAAACERPNRLSKDPILVEAYTFGDLLDGPEEVPYVEVALVLDLPAEQVTWWAEPPQGAGIVRMLELDKAPVRRLWRPAVWPVWNHAIRRPVRFWSLAGPDDNVLDALAERRLHALPRLNPSAEDEREQLQIELVACRSHLGRVEERYWDRDWRKEHKGFGSYPEHHLWEAVHGYLDVLRAVESM